MGGGRCLLYARGVFKRQAVGLALNAGVVDENTAVCSEAGESNSEVRVQLAYFTDGVRLRDDSAGWECVQAAKREWSAKKCLPAATWQCFSFPQQAQWYPFLEHPRQ